MPRPGPRPYECIRRAWHSESHQPLRGALIQDIFKVVNELHGHNTRRKKEWQEKLPVVVLRAEEILYSKAGSESEYANTETLRSRLDDAVNTMIRREETEEDGGPYLAPCIEAALSLGCFPKKVSRGQRPAVLRAPAGGRHLSNLSCSSNPGSYEGALVNGAVNGVHGATLTINGDSMRPPRDSSSTATTLPREEQASLHMAVAASRYNPSSERPYANVNPILLPPNSAYALADSSYPVVGGMVQFLRAAQGFPVPPPPPASRPNSPPQPLHSFNQDQRSLQFLEAPRNPGASSLAAVGQPCLRDCYNGALQCPLTTATSPASTVTTFSQLVRPEVRIQAYEVAGNGCVAATKELNSLSFPVEADLTVRPISSTGVHFGSSSQPPQHIASSRTEGALSCVGSETFCHTGPVLCTDDDHDLQLRLGPPGKEYTQYANNGTHHLPSRTSQRLGNSSPYTGYSGLRGNGGGWMNCSETSPQMSSAHVVYGCNVTPNLFAGGDMHPSKRLKGVNLHSNPSYESSVKAMQATQRLPPWPRQ